MPKIPANASRLLIEQAVEDKPFIQEPRDYLGVSQLGEECHRKLWYYFRWAENEELTQRQKRLFQRGHDEEEKFCDELSDAGVECHYVLDNQKEINIGFGHIKGHPDGIAVNIPDAPKTRHLLEFKTMKTSKFRELSKFSLERSNPKYWAQVQVYMYTLELNRCLFLVRCKETDETYYERVKLNKDQAREYIRIGEEVVMSQSPPPRMSENQSFYQCKWCQFHEICHNGEAPRKNCRTCVNSRAVEDGIWKCGIALELGPIPIHYQRNGCGKYSPRSML